MSDKSSIEWTDATWNPVTGCSKVSPGCAHCYAETISLRFGRSAGPWTPANAAENVVLHPERLDQPLRWRRPRMVFVNSMSDLFHEQIPDDYIARVFAVMSQAPQHTFQVLTKRPERMVELLADRQDAFCELMQVAIDEMYDDPDDQYCGRGVRRGLANVWLGVSIENRRFVHRADLLRQTPAAVRFISAEPLLGPLADPSRLLPYDGWLDGYPGWALDLDGIDWLIVGGESGPGHRPIKPKWVRDLRDLAADSGTTFFMKQMGGLRPGTELEDLPEDLRIREWPQMPSRGVA